MNLMKYAMTGTAALLTTMAVFAQQTPRQAEKALKKSLFTNHWKDGKEKCLTDVPNVDKKFFEKEFPKKIMAGATLTSLKMDTTGLFFVDFDNGKNVFADLGDPERKGTEEHITYVYKDNGSLTFDEGDNRVAEIYSGASTQKLPDGQQGIVVVFMERDVENAPNDVMYNKQIFDANGKKKPDMQGDAKGTSYRLKLFLNSAKNWARTMPGSLMTQGFTNNGSVWAANYGDKYAQGHINNGEKLLPSNIDNINDQFILLTAEEKAAQEKAAKEAAEKAKQKATQSGQRPPGM